VQTRSSPNDPLLLWYSEYIDASDQLTLRYRRRALPIVAEQVREALDTIPDVESVPSSLVSQSLGWEALAQLPQKWTIVEQGEGVRVIG
jgi:hypothetical protein